MPSQYTWPPVSPGGGGVTKLDIDRNNLAIDPTLSSVRSSAEDGGLSSGIPELHLPHEDTTATTMQSAIDSPSGLGSDVSFASMGEGPHSISGDMLGLPGDGGDDDDDDGSGKLGVGGPSGGGGGGGKEAPFSRSPELRVSHKLAERKRRKEMKDLFDELRETLPADRGMKASKWEILSKAVDFITHIKSQNHDLTREVESLRRELEMARGGGTTYPPPHNFASYPVAPSYPPQSGFQAVNSGNNNTSSVVSGNENGSVDPGNGDPTTQG